jgi:hypothetical protein
LVILRDIWLAIGVILLVYLVLWALAIVELLVLCVVLLVSRGPSTRMRDLFRRSVAARSQDLIHSPDWGRPAEKVGVELDRLRVFDPDFDREAFLDVARVAAFAYALAWSAEEDRLLRRVATPEFWQTTNGKAVASSVATWRRYAGDRPGSTIGDGCSWI